MLQYVAEQFPNARLAPPPGVERSRMQQWLGFIGTELHKAVFVPMLDDKASEPVKRYSREKLPLRMATLQEHLRGREFLLDEFSIADAYLTTILNWAGATQVDLKQWPEVHEYHQRMLKRPSIAKAAGEELAMYKEEVGAAEVGLTYFFGAYAMHSTSTRALRARPLAASALRAGKGFLKNSP